MKRWFKTLIVIFLIMPSATMAQVSLSFDHSDIVPVFTSDFNHSFFVFNPPIIKAAFDIKNAHSQKKLSNLSPTIYSVKELAFFCKIEVQLEKAARFPVKFRLGDVDYVDQLEGK